jgi:hypothetical protein
MQAHKYLVGRAILEQKIKPAHAQYAISQTPKYMSWPIHFTKFTTGNFFVFKILK